MEEESLGTVHLPLEMYNNMRDELDQLRKTTKTHEQFIQAFRASFKIITKMMSAQGIDMQQVYDYYKNLDFEVIDGVELTVRRIVKPGKPEYIVEARKGGEYLFSRRALWSEWEGHCSGALLLPRIAEAANLICKKAGIGKSGGA